jgi:hypothetical protein
MLVATKSPATKSPATKSPATKSPATKSPATKSPVIKKPAAVKPVAEQKTFTMLYVAALKARNIEAFSADTVIAINTAKSGAVALNLAMSKPEFNEIAANLIRCARIAKNTDDKANFVAVKVLVKIVKTLEGIGQGLASQLDPYTRTIGANLVKLGKITNKSNLVCLSKAIVYTETDSVQALKHRYSCSAGTAGTQSSSTRMMLKYLQVCDVVKGKQGDVMTLSDNQRARDFVALFTSKVVEAEHVAVVK